MAIKYLKKAPKTASTDDAKTREIVQTLLKDLETSKETGCKELTKKFEAATKTIIKAVISKVFTNASCNLGSVNFL